MIDEDIWKRRFWAYTAVRLASLAVFFLGIAVAYSDLVRVGGWPQIGAAIAIAGALATVLAPRLLKRNWDRQNP